MAKNILQRGQASRSEFEVFNAMAAILSKVVDDMESIEDNLAGALRGKYSSYNEALTSCEVFKAKVFSFFKSNLPNKEKIELTLELAEVWGENGNLKKAAKHLKMSYYYLLLVLKANGVIFPPATKSMKWRDFVAYETK
jgi:hypothetical protein